MKDQEESSELIEAIRNEGNAVYEKFQNDVFGVPNEENFGHYFKEELKRFAEATQDVSEDGVVQMVIDPVN